MEEGKEVRMEKGKEVKDGRREGKIRGGGEKMKS